ncbi:oligosaccharide flippase family protein [Ruminococcus sp.]|uniref:oligosaccharide flippase family protein n=1 Tax=Ruminococcus sp. TaxID=41978 RepID=UPI0025F7DF42|nr:oligosaccharide flippase family protein [Ruminococcus sp.]
MVGTSIKKNFIYNLAYQILIIILPLITSPYCTRVLGSDRLGVYSISQAIANYFVLFIMLGVSNYGNRTIAEVRDDKDKLSRTFFEIFFFQLTMGVVVCLAYVVYCVFFIKMHRIIYALQFIYVLSAVFDISWLFFGLEKFKATVTRSIIIKLINAACIFIFVKDKGDLALYTLILVLGLIINQLALWPILLKNKYVTFVKPTFSGVVKHIKPNLILFIPVIAVSLYNIMDKIMLGGITHNNSEVGFYTYAERIVQIPITLSTALGTVMMPRMSNLNSKNDTKSSQYLFDKAMQFSITTSMAFTFGLAAISTTFIPWFYGEEFVRCGYFTIGLTPIIAIKAWAHVIRTQYIIPQKMDNAYIVSVFSGAAVNLLLNIVLIKIINGLGAIIATVCAEFVVCIIQFGFIRKRLEIKQYVIDAVAFIFIGIIMFVPVFMLSSVNMFAIGKMIVQVCIGGVIYLSLSYVYLVCIKKDRTLVNAVLNIIPLYKRRKSK